MWPGAMQVLQWSAFRFLGRISFPIYLIHFPILTTLVLYVYINPSLIPIPFAVLGIGYFFLSILIAYALTIYVDEPTIINLRRASRLPDAAAFFVAHAV